jgi:hypothetical protein
MLRAKLVGVLAVVAVLGAAGIGYAAFTSAAFVQGSAAAGTFGPITWGSSGNVAPYYDPSCPSTLALTGPSVSSNGKVLYFAIGNMSPGDVCSVHAYLVNPGSLMGTLSEFQGCSVVTGPGGSCTQYTMTDNIPGATIPANSQPGVGCAIWGCYGVTLTITFSGGHHNKYQGSMVDLNDKVVGVAA